MIIPVNVVPSMRVQAIEHARKLPPSDGRFGDVPPAVGFLGELSYGLILNQAMNIPARYVGDDTGNNDFLIYGFFTFEVKTQASEYATRQEYEVNVSEDSVRTQYPFGYLFARAIRPTGTPIDDLDAYQAIDLCGISSRKRYMLMANHHCKGDISNGNEIRVPCWSLAIQYLRPLSDLRKLPRKTEDSLR
jgi:hypothetical protein